MTADFNSNFSLFPAQEKRSEKSPDFSGTIEIPVDQINSLVGHLGTKPESNYKDEPVIKLRIAGWKAESKSGKNYVNGKVSIPQAKDATATQASTDSTDESGGLF
jgi:hypothetical protein